MEVAILVIKWHANCLILLLTHMGVMQYGVKSVLREMVRTMFMYSCFPLFIAYMFSVFFFFKCFRQSAEYSFKMSTTDILPLEGGSYILLEDTDNKE